MRHYDLPKELAWMDTLNEMDELTALKEITAQLTKIQFDQDMHLNRSIDLVLSIDTKTHKPEKK